METSAKDCVNVDKAFWQLAKACVEIYNPKLVCRFLGSVVGGVNFVIFGPQHDKP